MFKRNIALLLALFMLVAGAGLSFAMGDGNYRKGKYLYRQSCRSCHDGSGAKELSPLTKTQADWQKTFDAANRDKIKCKAEWAKRSDQDLNDIYTYLWKHAKDSPTPAQCK